MGMGVFDVVLRVTIMFNELKQLVFSRHKASSDYHVFSIMSPVIS